MPARVDVRGWLWRERVGWSDLTGVDLAPVGMAVSSPNRLLNACLMGYTLDSRQSFLRTDGEDAMRAAFTGYLNGNGAEFGALHNSLAVDPGHAQVTYVDKATKEEALRNFPELKSLAERIVEPQVIVDFDTDRVLELADRRFDFVIANHLIEHLVNPLRWLENVSRILMPRAVLYLAVPNKDKTFDKNRVLTTNDHLWADYLSSEHQLSIEHLNDFLLNMTKDHIEPERRAWMYFTNDTLPSDLAEREKVYAIHRRRSIHVHVWNRATFDSFLKFALARLSLPWEIVDASPNDDTSHEMIYILRHT